MNVAISLAREILHNLKQERYHEQLIKARMLVVLCWLYSRHDLSGMWLFRSSVPEINCHRKPLKLHFIKLFMFIDILAQDCSSPIATALELPQSYSKPLIWFSLCCVCICVLRLGTERLYPYLWLSFQWHWGDMEGRKWYHSIKLWYKISICISQNKNAIFCVFYMRIGNLHEHYIYMISSYTWRG